jgi:DNA-binding transcriptional MerR regulator
MKIGEFAAFCDVSVRALHLYDRIGLFKPAYVDENSGYRYYLPEQMQTLNAIISYRKVGFSLQDIRELMSDDIEKEDAIEKLREKQTENDNIVSICQYNNEIIQSMLDALDVPAKKESGQEAALHLSRIVCLENEKLEHEFSQILWL